MRTALFLLGGYVAGALTILVIVWRDVRAYERRVIRGYLDRLRGTGG